MASQLDERLARLAQQVGQTVAQTDLTLRILRALEPAPERSRGQWLARCQFRLVVAAVAVTALLLGIPLLLSLLGGTAATSNHYTTGIGVVVAQAEQLPAVNRDAVVAAARRDLARHLAEAPRAKAMFLGVPAEAWQVGEVRQFRHATEIQPLTAPGTVLRLDPPQDVWIVTLRAEGTVESTETVNGVRRPYQRRVPLIMRWVFDSQLRQLKTEGIGAPVTQ
jgi:hypothetical protein